MPTKPTPRYNCTQLALYSICNTAWDNCSDNIATFAAYKSKYIPAFITAKKTDITNASNLPDDQTRETAAEVSRVKLVDLNGFCTSDFQKLKGYIEDAFPKNEWKAQFEAAGQTYYDRATQENWEYTVGLNNNMNAFIAANNAVLTAPGGMPAGFPAQVTSDAASFTTTYDDLKTYRETGVGTGGKIDANNAIYDDMQLMFRDAKRGVFPDEAEKLTLFTFQTLKDIVSPPGSASLRVKMQRPDNTVVPNVAVTIQSETGTPIMVETDLSGEAFFDKVDPDRYEVRADVATFKPVETEKDVDTGVNARMTIRLESL